MKSLLIRSIKVLCGLLVVMVLFHTVENWRGSRTWNAWQMEQAASGRAFDVNSIIPPPVKDSDNFALVPLIADAINGKRPLLDIPGGWPAGTMNGWQDGRRVDLESYAKLFPVGDVRKGVEEYRSLLDEFITATKKSACRINADYSRFPDGDVPSLLGFRGMARMLQLRALIRLRDGRIDEAYEDTQALLRTVQHFEKEPALISQLLRMAVTGIAIQPIWEGIQSHKWSEAQLSTLKKDLSGIDLLTSIAQSWRIEQAGTSALYLRVAQEKPWEWTYYPRAYFDSGKPSRIGSLVRHLLIPRGWVLQNTVRTARSVQHMVMDPLDPKNHSVDPKRQDEALQHSLSNSRTPYTFLAENLPLALAAQNTRAARLQAAIDQAVIACSLEKFHRKNRSFPDRLSDLGEPLPKDVIHGGQFHYRRTEGGGYLLYSVGWNAIDDGGQPGQGEDAIKKGDWVWSIHGIEGR